MIGSAASKTVPDKAERFSALTEPLRPLLMRRALQMTHNEMDAEDLVQDTYLRAYQFFDTYHSENSIQAWLFKIQKNLFINRFRRDQSRREAMPIDGRRSAEDLEIPAEGRLHEQTPRERLTNMELDEELARAMEQLPASFREILILAAIWEHSYEEMAVILVCPVGTIRSRLSRARVFCKIVYSAMQRVMDTTPISRP